MPDPNEPETFEAREEELEDFERWHESEYDNQTYNDATYEARND